MSQKNLHRSAFGSPTVAWAATVMLKGEKVGEIRVDLDIQELVIVECKAAKDGFCPTAKAQALSNIRVCGRPIGLLINFYGPELRVKRFIR